MQKVPLFIEVTGPKEVPGSSLCQQIRSALIPLGHTTLPFAASLTELQTLLPALAAKNLQPGIFVVNTFNARDIIQGLDPLLGESPVLFLRRNLYAGKSGLAEHFNIDNATGSTMSAINNLHTRLLSVWHYGNLNAPEIARNAARSIDQFLKTADFRPIELQSQRSIKTR
jgi:hypothetical protein